MIPVPRKISNQMAWKDFWNFNVTWHASHLKLFSKLSKDKWPEQEVISWLKIEKKLSSNCMQRDQCSHHPMIQACQLDPSWGTHDCRQHNETTIWPPQIHKLKRPLRPITSSIGSPTYAVSKHLVSILALLRKNTYTVQNSSEFVHELKQYSIAL